MGIAVSGWKLAREVSRHSSFGGLGVVSGTAINSVLVRKLQDGDLDGSMRKALKAFPDQAMAESVLSSYFVEGGKSKELPYKRAPMYALASSPDLLKLTVIANFCEVWLAKQGHNQPVGINLLEKILLPNLASLYGALLANVDVVIMGAGIPREIPGALDLLSQHLKASLKVPVAGSNEEHLTFFDPQALMSPVILSLKLKRPEFYPIVSSSVLAENLLKKSTGAVNGFIIEGPLAGGHNAPPRGPKTFNELGEPIYGERDIVDLKAMRALGLPFWLAGNSATPEKLKEALLEGAAGIQVGTLFAFSDESGLSSELKDKVIRRIKASETPAHGWVFTDPRSSPTGFPFKAVRMKETLSEESVYLSRKRICDLGYLRHAYMTPEGKVSQRCPAEPEQDYVKKGGDLEDTKGRKCLCNALMADIGLPQVKTSGELELPLLTAGDDLNNLHRILTGKDQYSFSAADVLFYLAPSDLQKLDGASL